VVTPTQIILIDVNQHPPGEYELRWVDENFNLVTLIEPALIVDASGFRYDVIFVIPGNNQGMYYLETRFDGSVVARSAVIEVLQPPPDLVVSNIIVPLEIEPTEEITIGVTIQNLSPSFVDKYFDVDLYIDPAFEPIPSQPGTSKQWLDGIGPLETRVVTHVVTLYTGGTHELWAQVDTSNWVPDESDETNNIFGPLGVTATSDECSELSDRFARPELDSKWLSAMMGNASVQNTTVEDDGTLSITTNGTGLWGSSDAGSTLLYQSFTGDFIATLKINQGLDTAEYAKFGLMARGNTSANSPLVMAVHTRDHGIQFGYRRSGGSMNTFANYSPPGVPVWVRLIRISNSFSAYYSFDGSSWSLGGTVENNLPETVLIGIAGASYNSSASTGNADDFEVCPIDADEESCQTYSDEFEAGSTIAWGDLDIGTTVPGSSSRNGGTMTVEGNGAGLWNPDNFHFTYQQVSGNFVASLKINSGPSQATWSKAGIMIRSSAASDGARVMVMRGNNSYLQFGVREYDGGSSARFGDDVTGVPLPVWVRVVRNGNTFLGYYSTDGETWTYRGSTTVGLPEDVMIGMGVSSYSSGVLDTGNFDDFVFCPNEGGGIESPPPPPDEKPPGLKECTQVIEAGDFEAHPITPPWMRTGDAYHGSNERHSGNFSLDFRASLGPAPGLRHLNPWAYQTVSVPGEVLPDTTGTLSYWQYVVPDPESGARDPDDYLYLAVRDSSGVTITQGIPLAQGTTDTPDWVQQVISVENSLPGNAFADLAGQDIQLKFYATHDGQDSGTHFYVDDVRCDICTVQPIPDDIPDTASIGGLVEVLLAGTPTKMPGIQVWAFAPGGALYRTQTIHNSTYHFYNIPPGTYTIYAEVWVGGHLYTVTTETNVAANERNYSVNLLLE
jgi:regulation of enolase protein 1 (concanavalin A-like superfamily)